MLVRLEVRCTCGEAIALEEGGAGYCPRDGSPASTEALGAIPPRSAFRGWHVALMTASTCLAVGASWGSYSMQSKSHMRLFQDLGRTLPAITNLVMHREVVNALFGTIAAACVYACLLAMQRIRRGTGVGPWPGRACFWMLFLTMVLDALIAEALHLPLVGLLESLR